MRASRPLRLEAVGEKPVEGHPAEAGQARLQVSRHVKVVGLVAGPKGDVPTHILCRTSPDPLAARNVEGTLSKLHGEGRHERCHQICSTNLVTVDTTCFKYLFLLSKSPFM